MAEPARIDTRTGPVGIGGWLILPLLWLAGMAVHNGWNVVEVLSRWETIAPVVARQMPPALWVVLNLALFLTAALSLWFAFMKKRAIIPTAMAHFLILSLASLMEHWSERAVSDVPSIRAFDSKFGDVVSPLIWVAYFYMSERVRNTFVEPLSILTARDRSHADPGS